MIRHLGAWLGAGRRRAGTARLAVLLPILALLAALAPSPSSAAGDELSPANTLDVILVFPDAGLAAGESVCVELYPDDGSDLAASAPLQAACLGPGQERVRFTGLGHGFYRAVVPADGSTLEPSRYQGQVASVEVPEVPADNGFEIDLPLALRPELTGTTGVVQVNVYGCPPGTDGGGDVDAWRQQCDALIGGAPVSLSGLGTVEQTAKEDVTAQEGAGVGRVEFTNLPPGEYVLAGELPANVAQNPAYFVESSIDGGLPGPIDPNAPLAVRPTEVVAVDVYVPLIEPAVPAADPDPAADPAAPTAPLDPAAAGLADPAVSGGLTGDPAPAADPGAAPADGAPEE